jgi:two-component system nitrate/nitrite response regulator NarL
VREKDLSPHVHLTPREREALRGVVAGRTNREIAIALGVSEQSVKNVLSTMYQKWLLRNRVELALFAVEHRLLSS